MRLQVIVLGLAYALLAGCGGEDPLVLEFLDLEAGTTHLPMPDARPFTARHYHMEVRSNVDHGVRLAARFDGAAPEGMTVKISRGAQLLPRSSGVVVLTVVLPQTAGTISGTIVIESPDLDGWKRAYTFAGDVQPRPRKGREVKWEGRNLGAMRPGEQKAFAVPIRSIGTDPVTLRDLSLPDGDRIVLERDYRGTVIAPGGEFQVRGLITAPKVTGPFRARIAVRSDADNVRELFHVGVSGKVVADYEALPNRIGPRADYPVLESKYPIKLHGREPFTVEEITGYEPVMRVLSKGAEQAAKEQTVVFQVKRDAPTDLRDFKIRIRLAPVGTEVVVPVRLKLYPPIHPQPDKVHFGRVPLGYPAKKEVRLSSFGNRKFEIESAQAQNGLFAVEVTGGHPLPWTVKISIPARSARGLLQDRILVETTDPDVPRIIVPVRADVR